MIVNVIVKRMANRPDRLFVEVDSSTLSLVADRTTGNSLHLVAGKPDCQPREQQHMR